MTIYKRPDNTIFAESAQSGEVVAFENMPRGWGVTLDSTKGIPPMEWFNFLQNRTDKAIQYILQNGITEYDTNLEYPQNAVVKSGGKLYLCLRQNTNKPLSNGAYWELLIKNATTSQGGIVQLSSSVTSTDETKASTPKATKTAYDKAVQANDNANTRVKIDGSTEMTEPLIIHKAQYPNVTLKAEGGHIYLETTNGKDCHLACRNTQDNLLWDIYYPQKNGTLLLDTDKSSSTTSDSEDTIATSLAVKKVNDEVLNVYNYAKNKEDKITRSSSTTSTSATDVATSLAIKTVNDNVKLNSNKIQSLESDKYNKSGGLITGSVKIKYSDYSGLELANNDDNIMRLETAPTSSSSALNVIYKNKSTGNKVIQFKKKTGVVLLEEDFSQNKSRNGWIKLPNGLVMQWGLLTQNSTSQRHNFNIAFNECFNVQVTDFNGGNYDGTLFAITDFNSSSFSIFCGSANLGAFMYFAVGR